MLNSEIYVKNPQTRKLVNDGVANVNDDRSAEALSVLRDELENFVCHGQYQKGMELILETFLKNLSQPEQPGVWVSGFYGSGKSHLVKMLRALWLNTRFPDGTAARDIVSNIPQSIRDLFRELDVHSKRYGGIHAASGTLGAAASGSVRLALLKVVLKSVGLPLQHNVASFVLWLKQEGILDQVKKTVQDSGGDWDLELDNFLVAERLFEALVAAKPKLFSSVESCGETLNNQYPNVMDIDNHTLVKTISLALKNGSDFPLTLLILDEVQQYIGDDSEKSGLLQETIETCCKNFGGRLLLVGTGQTAITATPNLKKLEGRFVIRVQLSESDVETVIRKVVLAKKPSAISPLNDVIQSNMGEISRHLSRTSIGHNQSDMEVFSQDYPVLPVRRRFWEHALRVLDQTGTDNQLRNQLSMIHKAIQTNLDAQIGSVIPADYLFFDSADKLLQSRIVPRNLHKKTMEWIRGNDDDKLTARACGLVFLINRLSSNKALGIKADTETLADLMIENIPAGSVSLRNRLPGLLDTCDLLMKVGDEYRIQTEESVAWNDDFLNEQSRLANETHRLESERGDRIRKRFQELVGKITFPHGRSKIPRSIHPVFESSLPNDRDRKICVWVRDGWSYEQNALQADARQAGANSPTIFVFLPKRSADDLRANLIEFKAASATLDKRGVPNSPEGNEARSAMETRKNNSESRIRELLDEAFSGVRVFQGGGAEVPGSSLQEMVKDAAEKSLIRLYQDFSQADHEGWDKVYEKSKKSAPDALKSVGHDGEPLQNPVCKTIMTFLGSGKKGLDVQNHFHSPPFGWSRDAMDGALQTLLVAGLIRAESEAGQIVEPKNLERKLISKTFFRVESVTVTAHQRIQIRKLFLKLGVNAKSGDELSAAPEFIEKLIDLRNNAGGQAPKPATPNDDLIKSITLKSGSEQLLDIYENREELEKKIDDWLSLETSISARWPQWEKLVSLSRLASGLHSSSDIASDIAAIEKDRLLLSEPDPVQPIIKQLEQNLRDNLLKLRVQFLAEFERLNSQLHTHQSWNALDDSQKSEILSKCQIATIPEFNVGDHDTLVRTLKDYPLQTFTDRIHSLSKKFDQALEHAVKLVEPKTVTVDIPRRTLTSPDDIDRWLDEVAKQLKDAISKGPVIVK